MQLADWTRGMREREKNIKTVKLRREIEREREREREREGIVKAK